MDTEITKGARILRFGWGLLVLLGALSLLFILWNHFIALPHPADEVEFWSWSEEYSMETALVETDLQEVIIAEIDFQDKPLDESLDFVIGKLNEGRKYHEPEIQCIVLNSEELEDAKITLKLANVRAVTGLRYVTSLALCKFSVEPSGEIQIGSLNRPPGPSVKAKFQCYAFVFPSYTGIGPFDVTSELTDAGVNFLPRDSAQYYPEKEVVVVQAQKYQLEIVDIYLNSGCVILAPSLLERIKFRVQDFFVPPPPPIVPTVLPVGPAADPFAPDLPSKAATEPKGGNPFQ